MIEVIIPGEAPSTPNLREHWAAKARRTKAQRSKVMAKVPTWGGGPLLFVRLTRVAPRRLDDDNLAGALKGHRDAVAARLRVDDASPLVSWEYHQANGEPTVVVQIWAASDDSPPLFSVLLPKRVKGKLKPGANSAATITPAEPCWHGPGFHSPGPCRRNTLECSSGKTLAPRPCPYPTCAGDCEHGKP